MATFQLRGNGLVGIRFPYSKERVDAIKSLDDRKWNKESSEWEIPISEAKRAAEILGEDWQSLPKSVRDGFEEALGGKILLSVGNTFTRIRGNDLPMEAVEDATSFWVVGAEFSKKYQDVIWDGQRKLFRKRGGLAFPTGLLSKIEKILTAAGHEYTLEDLRTHSLRGEPIQPHGPPLRDYQTEVLKIVTQKERGILQLATGAGKTMIAAHLIAARGLNSLFFVHTKDLLYQTIESFRSILGDPIGQVGDGTVRVEKITVATIQTAARALDVKIKKEPGDEIPIWSDDASERLSVSDWEIVQNALRDCAVVVFDECHHLPAESFYEIAMKLQDAYYRYGLSATPWRSDRSDLMIEAALGPKLCIVSSTELIKRGYLVPPKITMYEVFPTSRKLVRNYTRVYQSEIVENLERNRLIAEVAEHSAQRGKSVLILVNQVKHGRILDGMIDGAVFIHGRDSSEVRNEAIEQLRQKQNQILIATTLADEGLDLPSLDVLILAGAGKSETRALQRVGRALRPYPNKKSATIVDFWDQSLYLEGHSRQRFEIYETEPAFEVDIRPPRTAGKVFPRQKTLAEH
jgi:superfamily II DNA or RNA helicase